MTTPEREADLQRLAAIRRGDVAAFEAVFRELYDDLFRFARAFLHDDAAAEDLVDDVLGDLWIRRTTIEMRETLRAYLFGAVRNRARSAHRHEVTVARAQQLLWPPVTPTAGTPSTTPDADILQTELSQAVARAIATLPPRAREALMLKHEQELTYPEIAAVMGVSVKTVELHIARAFRGLREQLGDFRASLP